MKEYLVIVALVATCLVSCVDAATSPLMSTNIALVGADPSNTQAVGQNLENVLIDPITLIDQASALHRPTATELGDIEEDEHDRFLTSAKGKIRPQLLMDTGDDWANDDFVVPSGGKGPLSRVKRCGGGGDDDDDANRSRRSKRSRRTRKVRKSKKNGGKTTVVTRKVIQNGQVVSHVVETKKQTVVKEPLVQTTTTVQQVPVVQTAATVQTQTVQPVVQQVVPATQATVVPAAQAVAVVPAVEGK